MSNPKPPSGLPFIKRAYWVVGFVILIAGGLFLWVSDFSRSRVRSSDSSTLPGIQKYTQAVGATAPTTQAGPEAGLSFDDQFKKESDLIGAVDPHPDKSNRRLQDWADRLGPEDLLTLKKKALNFELNGDQRALSVFLLGLSPREEALTELGEIARSPIPDLPNDRAREFEMIYRAQAIEGLIRPSQLEASRQELKRTIAHLTDSTLLDRSIRGLNYLDGRVPSPKTQDEKALSQLIEP